MTQAYFAVDLGASSGRTIISSFIGEELKTEEVNRFPNKLIEIQGHYYWDLFALYTYIIEGLRLVARRKIEIISIGIDTWGVDFVMIGKDGHILRQPYAYRDHHTHGAAEKYFQRIPRSRVYELTGIQVMNFNSLFQFDTLRRNNDSAYEIVDKILFMPDALSWLLTGEMVTEYTIASTAQIVNAGSRKLDTELLYSVGLSEKKFGRFIYPGEKIGVLTKEVQRQTGLGAVPVIAVAGHDTASAVAAVPACGKNFAYISSGTWSLMGIEIPAPVINKETEILNFTNEGGVAGTIRLLKNICGMWLLERCRSDWPEKSYDTLITEAKNAAPFRSLINPDDMLFANPTDMRETIKEYCRNSGQPEPSTCGEMVRCIFESLALRYREVLYYLRQLSPHPIDILHVIGGGSKNDLLNQFTADSIGIPVVAGPSEATAIGNVMIQAIASGAASDILSMRRLVNRSIPLTSFQPLHTDEWDDAYEKFIHLTKKITINIMKEELVKKAYEIAQERYEAVGVNVEKAMEELQKISLSLHCWQADDVTGFENPDGVLSGGIQATGNFPGKARNPEELRQDLLKAVSYIPGTHRINLHAVYGDFGGKKVDRNEIEPEHFKSWMEWGKENNMKLDFNSTSFSHPKSGSLTLSNPDDEIRNFWIEHTKRSRTIAEAMGIYQNSPCVMNLWIHDGSKDTTVSRYRYREILKQSLDDIFSTEYRNMKDCIEAKLFGIGLESYTVGSYDFYLGYGAKNNKIVTLDTGHFHLTESVADKISSLLLFTPEIMLHVSRPVRWDSDHVTTMNDDTLELAKEIIRSNALDRVNIGLDYFDGSINRIGAYVVGTRATQKCFLQALLEPLPKLRQYEANDQLFERLALLEEAKGLPWNAVWDMFCLRNNVPVGEEYIYEIQKYEQEVKRR